VFDDLKNVKIATKSLKKVGRASSLSMMWPGHEHEGWPVNDKMEQQQQQYNIPKYSIFKRLLSAPEISVVLISKNIGIAEILIRLLASTFLLCCCSSSSCCSNKVKLKGFLCEFNPRIAPPCT
jgi:hypothetical protein